MQSTINRALTLTANQKCHETFDTICCRVLAAVAVAKSVGAEQTAGQSERAKTVIARTDTVTEHREKNSPNSRHVKIQNCQSQFNKSLCVSPVYEPYTV